MAAKNVKMRKLLTSPPIEPISEITTFCDPRGYSLANLITHEPTAFNGRCNYRQWKVTVTLVDEPKEVLIERVKKLWHECDNHHNWNAIQQAAAQLGITLNYQEAGIDRKTHE